MSPDHPHDSAWMWMPSEPPTWANLFSWHGQPMPLSLLFVVALAMAYAYLLIRLRSRGGRWPVGRTILHGLGIALGVLMCGTAFNGYGMALFSVHMVQHMVLSMLVPPLLLAGRPLTLALEAFDGTRVARGIDAVLASSITKFLTAVPVSLLVFVVAMYGLYLAPGVFDGMMANWFGHEIMLVIYVVTACLLYWPILGLDPGPHQLTGPVAFIAALIPMPIHSFFAIYVMQARSLIVDTYAHPPTGWHLNPMKDQELGGGLAWAFADIPNLVLVIIVVVNWVLASRREAREFDAAEAASDDAELTAYNRMLERLGD